MSCGSYDIVRMSESENVKAIAERSVVAFVVDGGERRADETEASVCTPGLSGADRSHKEIL